MSDHAQIRDLFEQNPGKWFSAVDVAEACMCQHNSFHRALKVQLSDMLLEKRRMEHNKSRMEYRCAREAQRGTTTTTKDFCQVTRCESCGVSFWATSGACTVCGADRQADVDRAREPNVSYTPKGQK